MTLSLAFLAPALVKAAIEGRLPRGFGVTRLDGPSDGVVRPMVGAGSEEPRRLESDRTANLSPTR